MEPRVVGLQRGRLSLRPHSPEWARSFQRERTELLANVPAIVEVEHVGSTAIPDLEAKPVIDMQAALRSFGDWPAVVRSLANRGYTFMPERVFDARVFLPKGPEERRTHYLSLIEIDTSQWRQRLRFRDALRADAALRQEYQELKRGLLRQHAHDRAAYTCGKSEFVDRVLAMR